MKRMILILTLIAGSFIFLGSPVTTYAYTQAQIQQAKAWLSAHGYSPTRGGAQQAYNDYLKGKFDKKPSGSSDRDGEEKESKKKKSSGKKKDAKKNAETSTAPIGDVAISQEPEPLTEEEQLELLKEMALSEAERKEEEEKKQREEKLKKMEEEAKAEAEAAQKEQNDKEREASQEQVEVQKRQMMSLGLIGLAAALIVTVGLVTVYKKKTIL